MSDDRVQQVIEALDPQPASEVDWPVSRRQALRALAAAGLVGAGSGSASAESAGTVIADEAFLSNYDSESVADGWELTIDDDVFALTESEDTIGLPDGGVGEEVVLPSGAEAAEVIAPDGTVVFESPPDLVAYGGDDNNTYVHDVSDGSLVQTLTESGSFLRRVALSDTHVAYGGDDNNTYVHDLADGSLVQTLTASGGDVNGVALSDTYVAYGGDDDNTYVHDVSDGSLVETLTESGDSVQGVALSDAHVAYGGRLRS